MTIHDKHLARPAGQRLPKLGFLGVGWIGRNRMQAIVEAGAADVSAIVEPSEETLAAALAAAPGAATMGSLEEMLALDELDGIVIATPSALHAEQSIRALQAGKAVFCQKPLGRNAEEVARVVEAARRNDRLLGVDLSYRFTSAVAAIRDALAAGQIGDVFAADLTFHNAYGPDKPWFYDPRQSGGGCVVDLGVHLVDLALWLLDFPEIVEVDADLFANGRPLTDPETQAEDYATARLRLSGGAVINLSCSWRLHAGQDAVIAAAFHGTGGGLSFRNTDGSFYDFVAERHQGTSRTILSSPDEWGGRAAVEWARQLAARGCFNPQVERMVDVTRALDGIYSTARNRVSKSPRS